MTHRGRIRRRIDQGATVEQVDEEVIAPDPALSADQRSALWLYAWSLERARERAASGRFARAPFPERRRAAR